MNAVTHTVGRRTSGDLQTVAWIPVSALLGSGLPDALQGAISIAAARRGMIL
jgi:hypothetical protein